MKKVFFVFIFSFLAMSIFGQSNEYSEYNNGIAVDSFSGNSKIAMANPNYIVTAGDVYSLNYAIGGTAVSYTIPVDSTYKIRVANLAVLDVKGKTFLKLKSEVEKIVIQNYPMSGVQFVLLSPSNFKVVITGEVETTQEKNAWALTRVSDVLKSGLTDYSSKRNILIKSTNGKSKVVDLFKAEREGGFISRSLSLSW